jgi:hypothetical protein
MPSRPRTATTSGQRPRGTVEPPTTSDSADAVVVVLVVVDAVAVVDAVEQKGQRERARKR